MADEKFTIDISSTDESDFYPTESDDDDAVEETSSSSCYDDDDDEDEYDDDDDDDDDDDEDEDEDDEVDDDDDSQQTISDYEEDDEDLVDEDGESVGANADEDGDKTMWNKVIRSIRGGGDLQELKLKELKAYLRRHDLRMSGTRQECIDRIKEHLRLKDGNGEALYPRSSFIINCTGDVCRGDIVLFSQEVYQTFEKMKRRGSLLGRRTIAGRVVKESYGAAKQQHTFTVEVLWSKGHKKLDPLFPLLVKGRNLYKLKTYRQRWKNEQDRLEVISEKHRRGAAARSIRALRKSKAAAKTNKSWTNKGVKKSKHFHHIGPSGTGEKSDMKKSHQNEHRNAFTKTKKRNSNKNLSASKTRFKTSGPASHSRYQSNQVREPPYNYHSRSNGFPREVHPFPSHNSERREFNHGRHTDPGYSQSKSVHEPRNIIDNQPSTPTDTHRWR